METSENKREFVNKLTIKLAEYETERRKGILRLILLQILSVLAVYVFFKGTVFFIDNHPYIAVFSSILSFTSVIYFFYNFSDENKKFKKFLKGKCKRAILKTFNLTTMTGGIGFTDEILRKSNLFCTYTYQETDDVIEGTYNDVDYAIAETKLVAKGRKSDFEVFKGVIISFNSNKKISAETLITTKGDNQIRNYPPNTNIVIACICIFCILIPTIFVLFYVASIAIQLIESGVPVWQMIKANSSIQNIYFWNMLNLLMPIALIAIIAIPLYVQKKKMQDVKLEDVFFDKKFNVCTKDQIEARYLVTSAFMDRLKSLETSFGTKGIKCSFFDDKIMFAIPTRKDLFELGSLYCSAKSNKHIDEFYDEISSIQKMIEHLKLNENTGL